MKGESEPCQLTSHVARQHLILKNKNSLMKCLRKEIEYRRDKAWKIFSWASTILLGTIGGLVAIYNPTQLRMNYFLVGLTGRSWQLQFLF